MAILRGRGSAGDSPVGDPRILTYTRDYYAENWRTAQIGAEVVLPEVFEVMGIPESLIDLGCGAGAWSYVAQRLGVGLVLGIDGEWARAEWERMMPITAFIGADLETVAGRGAVVRELQQIPRFRAGICVEVMEHLSPKAATFSLAILLTEVDWLIFGAATPGQGGSLHVNEQPHAYWRERLELAGFEEVHGMRPESAVGTEINWGFQVSVSIPFWYRDNIQVWRRSPLGYLQHRQ